MTRTSPFRSLFLAAAGLALSASPLLAQDWKGQGRLFGRVQGPDGKPVEGATVTADCPSRGGGTSSTTDKKGQWSILGVVACSWSLEIKAEGLRTHTQQVNMTSEQARLNSIDVKLEKQAGPPPALLAAVKAGDDAFAARNWAVARENYEKILVMRPDLGPQVFQKLAQAYGSEGNNAKAIEYLEKSIAAAPERTDLRFAAAQTALESGLTDKGMEFLKGIDDASVKGADGYFNLAVYFLRKSDAPNAVDYFSKAIAKDGTIADAFYWRGMSYVRLGKTAEAKADMQKAAELDPAGDTGNKARKALEQLK